jgi:hypothetical protein
MRDTTTSCDPWTAGPPAAKRERSDRNGSHVRHLLVIAAMLLAFALALDDRVVGWALGPPSDRISAVEEQHLERVRSLLQLRQERHAEPAGQQD